MLRLLQAPSVVYSTAEERGESAIMPQLDLSSVARFGRARRPMPESPRGKLTLTCAAFAAWLVTASVGVLLPALASVAAEVSEAAKLLASDGAEGDHFGDFSVAVAGDTAVIGAWGDDDDGIDSGSAYVFRYNGTAWVEEAKLTASDAAEGDHFGGSVTVSGDTVVVGAYADDDNGSRSGSAYVFRYSGTAWVEEAKLTASDGAADDFFGFPVAVSGDTVVVGAGGDDDNGIDSGAAYVYNLPEPTMLALSLAALGTLYGIRRMAVRA